MVTPLQGLLTRHLDTFISGPDGDIEAILIECLRESSSSWRGVSEVGVFLFVLRDLRFKHSQGMSKRPRKRKAVVDNLVTEVRRIREEQELDWWMGIATYPIAAVVEKRRDAPVQHLDAVLESLLQLSASFPHILDEQIHHFLRGAHARLTCLDHLMQAADL